MSKRILAVEDQPDNRQIIRDMLAPTDYEITEAENGEEELAAIASQRPDLILMDIQLPIMDGYTARAGLKPILVTAMMGIDRKALPMRSAGRRRRPGRPGGPSAHALADDISETKPRPKSPNRTTMAVEAENRTPRVPRSSKKLLSGNQIHPSRLLPWMGSKRILVVEDQPDNRQIIRDMLAPTDYEITEAENGEQALAAIAKQPPDLILMDIQLPIMDGYTATRQIKADPALRSIPIIAVTSYALSGEEKKARAIGCDDCVSKPYSPRQLLAKIRQYVPE